VLAYAAGVFDGAPDGGSLDTDANDGKDLAARVMLSPFKRGGSLLKSLGVGISATTGRQAGALPSYRSGGQLAIFAYNAGVTADGTRTRVSPQLLWEAGRLGLLAEFVTAGAELRRSATVADRLGLLLTGDAAAFAGVKPRRAFDPARRQWGALELAARVNGMALDADAFSRGYADPARSVRKALAWAVGLNWYASRNVKQMVSFERTSFRGGAAEGDRPAENALLIRSQVAF
jgi:phosphate-selective porin OprO/OprP